MQIAVTTPTGHVGTHVTRMLVQAGVRPTVLLRDAGRLDPELRELVDVREGDLGDPAYVREATAGVDSLFWVDPTDYGAEDINAETARLGEHVAAAVDANRIGRVVFQSSVGAELRHGAGLIDGLAEVEQLLERTGADVLHLRCGYFFTNLLLDLEGLQAGTIRTFVPPDMPMPWVDPRDIAGVVTTRLLSGDWSGQGVQAVHGPADLTWPEVPEVLASATGRKIRLEQVSQDDVRRGLLAAGMGERTAQGIIDMTAGMLDGFVPEQPRSVLSTTPTTLGEWAHEHLRPLLAG